jgi:AcrR family transcriptional regulator
MRKKQIVDEAFKLFSRQGYGPTTMQQIGDAVGLDKSSLYVHFKNKCDIFTVILETELQSYKNAVLNETLNGKNFKEVSHKLIENTLSYFSNHDRLLFWKHLMLMPKSDAYADIAEQVSGIIYRLNNDFTERLQAMVNDTEGSDSKLKLSLGLFIIAQGLMDWLVVQGTVDDEDIIIATEVCGNILDTCQLFNSKTA